MDTVSPTPEEIKLLQDVINALLECVEEEEKEESFDHSYNEIPF